MPKISVSLLKTYLFTLFFSAAQMIVLRVLLKQLGLKIGWNEMTDFDVVVPMVIAFFILLAVLDQGMKISPVLQKKILAINLGLALGFLFVSVQVFFKGGFSSLTYGLWIFFLLSLFLSSLCVFLPPSFFILNPNSWAVFPALLLSTSVISYQHFYESLWPSLLPLTGKVTCGVLTPFLGNAFQCSMTDSMNMLLRHKYFWADIAAGCSGLDGQLFFLISFLMLVSLFGKKVGFLQYSALFFLGSFLIFFANVFRIIAFFLIGVFSATTSFHAFGRDTMLFLFHAHAGWFFYSLVLLIVYSLVRVQESAGSPGNSLIWPNLQNMKNSP